MLSLSESGRKVNQFPADPPHDYTRLIEQERAALIDVLRSIRDDDWTKPTVCPGWSVHDLVLHVLGTDIGVISRQRDDHAGSPGPSGATASAFETFLDSLNDDWVRSMRCMSPRMSIDLLARTGRELVDLYCDTSGSVRDARVSWASSEPVPRWFDHARELTERWVHHQQILDAIGASAWFDANMVAAVLDTFSHAYRQKLSGLRRSEGTTAGVDITGEVARSWRWESTGKSWVTGSSEAETLITMDVAMAWRLLTNGLSPDQWPEPSPAKDLAVARALLRTRAILATPNG